MIITIIIIIIGVSDNRLLSKKKQADKKTQRVTRQRCMNVLSTSFSALSRHVGIQGFRVYGLGFT